MPTLDDDHRSLVVVCNVPKQVLGIVSCHLHFFYVITDRNGLHMLQSGAINCCLGVKALFNRPMGLLCMRLYARDTLTTVKLCAEDTCRLRILPEIDTRTTKLEAYMRRIDKGNKPTRHKRNRAGNCTTNDNRRRQCPMNYRSNTHNKESSHT